VEPFYPGGPSRTDSISDPHHVKASIWKNQRMELKPYHTNRESQATRCRGGCHHLRPVSSEPRPLLVAVLAAPPHLWADSDYFTQPPGPTPKLPCIPGVSHGEASAASRMCAPSPGTHDTARATSLARAKQPVGWRVHQHTLGINAPPRSTPTFVI
jgi:hypothetical protein